MNNFQIKKFLEPCHEYGIVYIEEKAREAAYPQRISQTFIVWPSLLAVVAAISFFEDYFILDKRYLFNI